MVTSHFRWDFIGLSTDDKPTPETSSKVVDGSTYYCSDNSKLYVWCKDQWYERKPLGGGGGTTYTAGDNITITDGVISATDTTYSAFTGTDGSAAGTAGLVPAPATTDAGKFLKADGTWDTAGGGGGGDIVYSTKNTSNSENGGAVYIGGKDANQQIYLDPSTTDANKRFFWALPYNSSLTGQTLIPGDDTLNIGGSQYGSGVSNVTLGYRSACSGDNNTNIGFQAGTSSAMGSCVCVGSSAQCQQNHGVAIGRNALVSSGNTGSVAIGVNSATTRSGEINVGSTRTNFGYNSTNYRVIGGVHDGQLDHDAVTVEQVNAVIDAINTALSVNIPHIGTAS